MRNGNRLVEMGASCSILQQELPVIFRQAFAKELLDMAHILFCYGASRSLIHRNSAQLLDFVLVHCAIKLIVTARYRHVNLAELKLTTESEPLGRLMLN